MAGGQLAIVVLGEDEFGIPIEHVREIMRVQDVRSIPDAPDFIQGLINLRGQAIPLINMHVRFGIMPSANNESKTTYAIITDFKGILVALSVDGVREVRTSDDVVSPPPLVKVPYINGIVNLPDRIIMKLDLETMLKDSGLEELSCYDE